MAYDLRVDRLSTLTPAPASHNAGLVRQRLSLSDLLMQAAHILVHSARVNETLF